MKRVNKWLPPIGACVRLGRLADGSVKRVRKFKRAGLTLLEVIIAMAILAMSATLLYQVSNLATNSALEAQRLANAHILSESKMAEILAGAVATEPMDWTLDSDGTVPGEWYYKLETSVGERENMIGLKLSVSDNPTSTTRSQAIFTIVRYIIDPQLGLDTPPSSDGSSSTGEIGSSTGGSATTGSSSGGTSSGL